MELFPVDLVGVEVVEISVLMQVEECARLVRLTDGHARDIVIVTPLARLNLPPLCLDMRERSHERLRLAVVVARLSPAADRGEELSMLLRLDALGKCLDAEVLGHGDDRTDDAARLLRGVAQKAHVELDEVDRVVLEDVQRRVAAAEIVEPDLIALVPQAVDSPVDGSSFSASALSVISTCRASRGIWYAARVFSTR